jgi:PAS domain S-box-containing protein
MSFNNTKRSLRVNFIRFSGVISLASGLLYWLTSHNLFFNFPIFHSFFQQFSSFWSSTLILAGFALICSTLSSSPGFKTFFVKLPAVLIILNSGILAWLMISNTLDNPPPQLITQSLPGIMASFSQLLLGSCLLLTEPTRNITTSNYFQYSAMAGILISLGSAVGYFFGFNNFIFQLEAPLGIFMLLLFIGILLCRPDLEILSLFTSENQVSRIAGKLLILSTLIPMIIGWAIIKGHSTGKFDSSFQLPLFAIAISFVQSVLILYNAFLLQKLSLNKAQTEDSIKQKEELIQILASAQDSAYYDYSLTQNKGYINKRWAEMLEYNLEEIPPTPQLASWVHSHIHPKDLPLVLKMYHEFINGHISEFKASFCIKTKSGKWVWHQEYCKATQRDNKGKALAITGVKTDITEKKKLETALKESEDRFETMANAMPVMMWLADVDKRCTFFNKTWLKFTGKAPQQEYGFGWTENIHFDDLQRYLGIYYSSFDTHKDFEIEFRIKRFDGNYRWVIQRAIPRFLPDGTFIGYIGSCVDVTKLKQAVEALHESEERYQNLFEFSPSAIFIQSKGRIIFANKQTATLFKVDNVSELIGKPINNYYDPAVQSGQDYFLKPFEDIVICADGSIQEVNALHIPYNYNGIKAVQVIAHGKTQNSLVFK